MVDVRKSLVLVAIGIAGFLVARNFVSQKTLGVNTDNSITVGLAGDVMLGRSVNTRIKKYGRPGYPFEKISERLKTLDLMFVNLESPLAWKCPTTDTGMVFCGEAESLSGLIDSGVDVLSIENNHHLNQGVNGDVFTKQIIEEKGMIACEEEELKVNVIKGVRFGWYCKDMVFDNSKKTVDSMLARAVEYDSQVDVLVFSLHWGPEYIKKPQTWMVEFAHQLVDSGVDVVAGHHSHVVGEMEEYKGKPVFYSLGNLVFDQMWSRETREGGVAVLKYDGSQYLGFEFWPTLIEDYSQPKWVE